MSDPVNSSDEVMQMAWQAVIDAASKGQIYELAIDDELDEFKPYCTVRAALTGTDNQSTEETQ